MARSRAPELPKWEVRTPDAQSLPAAFRTRFRAAQLVDHPADDLSDAMWPMVRRRKASPRSLAMRKLVRMRKAPGEPTSGVSRTMRSPAKGASHGRPTSAIAITAIALSTACHCCVFRGLSRSVNDSQFIDALQFVRRAKGKAAGAGEGGQWRALRHGRHGEQRRRTGPACQCARRRVHPVAGCLISPPAASTNSRCFRRNAAAPSTICKCRG